MRERFHLEQLLWVWAAAFCVTVLHSWNNWQWDTGFAVVTVTLWVLAIRATLQHRRKGKDGYTEDDD
jgi:membrane protein implicated in regulation of membrane protease activity